MQKKHPVTRTDVAKAAGVSTATVSYVINNGPRQVSAKTRAKVQKAIDALGYRPNELARSLRLKRSTTIGLIIPNLGNQVYAEIAISLESACRAEGYLVVLCNSGRDPEQEKEFVHLLRAQQVAGVVMIPSQEPQQLIEPIEDARIPVVILEHDVPNHHCLVVDDLNSGWIGTTHLLNLGHRRIGMINRTRHSGTSALRVSGYQQALIKAGITIDPSLIVEAGAGYDEAYRAMQRLLHLPFPPTAVFTHNDVQALGAMRAIESMGLAIPGDISVVGHDDIASSPYLTPPLTTVRYPKVEMGQLAAQKILQLARQRDGEPRTHVLSTELIVRGSTAPPPHTERLKEAQGSRQEVIK